MKTRTLLPTLALAAITTLLMADAVKDREGAVRQDRAKMENDARWIYNDVARGFAEAKRTGKPMLAVLRCVPCLSCMGMDAGVLTQAELAPLLDQFVCVRIINANALDLALFQVDYDLSFSTVIFNGDGTVYGRFGSWQHQKNAQDTDTAGFKRALEAALAIHKNYPANKAALTGKQGATLPFKTAVEIPLLAAKYQRELDWQGKVVQSCVHCHQIGDALRAWYRTQKKPMPDEWLYPWPAPANVGLTLAPDQAARVQDVAAGSTAAAAGLRAGDEIVSLAGQPLVSIADVSWVLNRAPDPATLAVVVKRDGAEKSLSLDLAPGWRGRTDNGKRVANWSMRGMATGGMVIEDLADDARKQRGLDARQMALDVKFVGQYGNHAAAKNAGFKKEDLIIAVGGLNTRMSEGELFGHLLKKHFPGEKVPVTVNRGGQKMELSLPMQ